MHYKNLIIFTNTVFLVDSTKFGWYIIDIITINIYNLRWEEGGMSLNRLIGVSRIETGTYHPYLFNNSKKTRILPSSERQTIHYLRRCYNFTLFSVSWHIVISECTYIHTSSKVILKKLLVFLHHQFITHEDMSLSILNKQSLQA